eukprot:Seg2960.1 transcript_id=Seg2960.1/GoldUCD/mRNA.D3Y31 product="Serum response factor-binding protein 1" protein_id=Seg2960.1/GoldUCD/D3Y31
MVENLHIPGGSLKPKLSNLTKNELKLRFRPDQAIKKGSQVKIEYLLRDQEIPANLVEVKFWRKVVCSSKPCDPNATTPIPPSTAAPKPTMFPKCRGVLRVIQTGPSFFKGVLSLPVIKAMNGWKLELLFSRMVRISNFPAKLVEKRRRRYFVLENLPADKDIDAGTFKFLILVHFKPSLFKKPQLAMVKFGSYECRLRDDIRIPPTKAPRTKPSEKPPTKGPGPKTTQMPAPGPETEGPATELPATEKPATEGPETVQPSTEGQTIAKPSTEEPLTEKPATVRPATVGPATRAPITAGPTTEGPTKGPGSQGPTEGPTESA